MTQYILGISAYYHDSAAALLADGEIIGAAQEERFTRKKHDPGFPKNAVEYCLKEAGIGINDVDHVCFYDKPFTKFERLLETYLSVCPSGFRSFLKSIPVWLGDKLWMDNSLSKDLGYDKDILYAEHHESHAASAFYPSPFEKALVLTLDGVGEWATSSISIGSGNKLELLAELEFPHSLGLLYSAFTYYTGFKVNSGEYKVMGLAPYGEPKYKDLILEHIVELREDGSFKLNMEYFNFHKGLTMTSEKFHNLLGGPPREGESTITQKEMDLARSVQEVTEEIVLKIAEYWIQKTGVKQVCMAGGVALNCVANGKLLRSGLLDDLWIQPAAGDAGGALGCALAVWHKYLDKPRTVSTTPADSQKGSYLGPAFSTDDAKTYFDKIGVPYQVLDDDELIEKAADILAEQKVVGWHQGRMEFGPRALGGRSIVGDPRSQEMQKVMNLKIKYRESFRPFAPSVLREDVSEYFDMAGESPYMLLVADVNQKRCTQMTAEQSRLFGIEKLNIQRSDIPAITHVDYSARVQTVDGKYNPRYHALISKFKEKTGCAVLVNTSFNVRGEPIVCTAQDSYLCFMRTEMDYLVVENCLLDKRQQPELKNDANWRDLYELD
jgi:carbamoyltransferase